MKNLYNICLLLGLLTATFQLKAQFDEPTACDASNNPVVFGTTTQTISLTADFDPATNLTPFVTDNAGGAIQNFGCTPGDSAIFFKLEVDPNARYLELEYTGSEPDVSVALVQIGDPQCPSGGGTNFQESVYLDDVGDPMSDCAFDGTGDIMYSFCNSTTVLDPTTLYLWVSTASGNGTVNLDVTQYVAPTNDECLTADDLGTINLGNEIGSCNGNGTTFTTVGACGDAITNDACFDQFEEGSTVWYTFMTGDDVSKLSVDIAAATGMNGAGDLRMSLFALDNGCAGGPGFPTDLQAEYCVEVLGGGADSLSRVIVFPNTTYAIAVNTDAMEGEWGEFELCVRSCTPPANDNLCPGAAPITGAEDLNFSPTAGTYLTATGTTDCASPFYLSLVPGSRTFSECDGGNGGPADFQSAVFYKLNVDPYATKITIFGSSSDPDITGLGGQIILFNEATDCGGMPQDFSTIGTFNPADFPDAALCYGDLQNGKMELNLCGVPNTDYDNLYLVVFTDREGEGSFELNYTQEIAPYNDLCDDPSSGARGAGDIGVLNHGEAKGTCDGTLAPLESNRGACPDLFGGNACLEFLGEQATVWYEFTTGDGVELIDIEVEHETAQTINVGLIELDPDCSATNFNFPPNAEQEDYCKSNMVNGGLDSLSNILVQENTRYYIVISTDSTEWGEFQLCVSSCEPPINDQICEASTDAIITPLGFPDDFQAPATLSTTVCANSWFQNNDLVKHEIGGECFNSVDIESTVFYKINLDSNATEFRVHILNPNGIPVIGGGVFILDETVEPCATPRDQVLFEWAQNPDGSSVHNCDLLETDTLIWELCDVSVDVFDQVYVAVATGRDNQGEFEIYFSQKIGPPNDECINAEPVPPIEITNPTYVGGEGFVSQICLMSPENQTTLFGCEDGYNFDQMVNPNIEPECFDPNRDVEYSVVWYNFRTDGDAGELDLTLNHTTGTGFEDDELIISLMTFPEDLECLSDPDTIAFCETDEDGDGIIEMWNTGVRPNKNYYLMIMTPKSKAGEYELCLDVTPPKPCLRDPVRYYNYFDPLCGISDLDGTCFRLLSNGVKPFTPIQPWPGCNNWSFDNPNWITFVAGGPEITLEIVVDACEQGGGAQVAVYGPLQCDLDVDTSEMDPPIPIDGDLLLTDCNDLNCGVYPPEDPYVFEADNLVPGELYGIAFDGCSGDVCDVQVSVTQGQDTVTFDGETLDPPQFDNGTLGQDSLCLGATATFSLTNEIPGACNTRWTLYDPNGDIILDTFSRLGQDGISEISYTFNDPGTFNLCVGGGNLCATSDTVCIPIVVFPLQTVMQTDTICEGGDGNMPYVWVGPYSNMPIAPMAPGPPAIDVDRLGNTRYYGMDAEPVLGCPAEVILDLFVRNENDENPTEIDTIICESDLDFELYTEEFDRPQDSTIVQTISPITGCDTFFALDLFVLGGEPTWDYYCVGDGTMAFYLVPPTQTNVSPWEDQLAIFNDPTSGYTIEYNWFSRFNDPLGTADTIFLTQDELEMFSLGNELGVYVEYTILFDGFVFCSNVSDIEDINLDLWFPSADINGPIEFCPGTPNLQYFASIDSVQEPTPDDSVRYNWILPNGFTYSMGSGPMDDTIFMDAPNDNPGQFLCLEVESKDCRFTDSVCLEVEFGIPPKPVLGPDDATCDRTYTFSPSVATGGAGVPGWTTITQPMGSVATFSSIDDPNATVTVSEAGIYEFQFQDGVASCARYDTIQIEFYELPRVDNYIDTCFDLDFQVTIDLTGGSGDYSIDASSTISGTIDPATGQFVSDTVAIIPGVNFNDSLYLIVRDNVTGCVSDSILIVLLCDCDTEEGMMSPDTIEACEGESVTAVYLGGHLNDGTDTLMYILHTGDTNRLGTVIDTSLDGTFAYTTRVNFNQVYYISRVIGNAVGPNGEYVDLDDICLRVAIGQPVIWYENPMAEAGMDDRVCGFSTMLSATPSVGQGNWTVQPANAAVIFSDGSSPTTEVTVPDIGTYTFRWTEDNNGCSDFDEVEVEFEGEIFASINYECNGTATQYEAIITLSGGGDSYTIVSGDATIMGNVITTSPIGVGLEDTIIVDSDLGCGPDTIPLLWDCICISETGSLDSSMVFSACVGECIDVNDVYDTTGQVFDGNDIGRFILHNTRDTGVANVDVVYEQNEDGIFCWDDLAGLITPGEVVYVAYIVGNPDGAGGVSLTDPCAQITYGARLFYIENPTSDAGMDTAVCGLAGSLSGTNSVGTGSWQYIGSNPNVVIADANAASTTFTSDDYGPHEFVWEVENDNCFARDTVTVTLLSSPEVDVNSIMYFCDDIGENYYVTFTVLLGEESSLQTVDNNGSFAGRTFTSIFVPSDSSETYRIFDGNMCDTFEITLDHSCPCLTEIDEIEGQDLDLCADQSVSGVGYTPPAGSLDGNDEVRFTLEDNAGTRIFESTTAQFSFDATTMTLGTPYFIYVYVGTVRGGVFEYEDECTLRDGPIRVTWWPYPQANAIPEFDTLTCEIEEIQIDGSASVGPNSLSYAWTTTNGNIVSGSTSAIVSVSAPGDYRLEVTDAVSGCSDDTTITIEQSDDIPTVTIREPVVLDCNVREIVIDGSSSTSGPTISYQWTATNGGNIIGSTTGNTIRVDEPGTYELVVTDEATSCENVDRVVVSQNITPPMVIATVNGELDCSTEEVEVDAIGSSTGPNFRYSWSTQDGNIIGGTSGSAIVANEAGFYTLVIENTENGCIDSTTVEVTVNPIALDDIIVDARDPQCHDEINGIIEIRPVGGQEPITYRLVGVDENSTGVFANLGPGDYEIEVVDANGCRQTASVSLFNPPLLSIQLLESIVIEKGESVDIRALLPSGAIYDTIIWDTDTIPYECVDPTCETINIRPPNTTEVRATVIGGRNCADEDAVKVIVKVFHDIFIPNVFSPNGSGINDYFLPAAGRRVANINYMQIYDRWGTLLFESQNFLPGEESQGWDGSFRGKDMNEGVYVYKVEVLYENGNVEIINGSFALVR